MNKRRGRPAKIGDCSSVIRQVGICLVLILLHGCSNDEQLDCMTPSIIADFCGSSQDLGECDCISDPIDIIAFIDYSSIPDIYLVGSAASYGDNGHRIQLGGSSFEMALPDSLLEIFEPDDLLQASVRRARIVKLFMPTNDSVLIGWYLEVDSSDQVDFEFVGTH